jgi:hypothetical protein
MKTGADWFREYEKPLRDGIRHITAEAFFDKLVRRIQADALDSIAAELKAEMEAKKMPNPPWQVVSAIKCRAREVSP